MDIDLVPITLDLAHGPWRLKGNSHIPTYLEQDTLLWNRKDQISLEEFAALLCSDLRYPKAFEDAIVASMKSQIQLHDNVRKRRHLYGGG
jgi:hypothetical protein